MYADAGKFDQHAATDNRENHVRRSPGTSTGTHFSSSPLVIDFVAQQGWGKLANGTIVWADDHRATPTEGRSGRDGTSTP